MSTSAPEQAARDVRVDTVGYVNELQKHLADGQKTRVKVRMLEDELTRVEGDAFAGVLVTTVAGVIDADKWLRLYERKQISRAQFVAAVTVSRSAAMDAVSGGDLAKITNEGSPVHSLRVGRKPGVEVPLADAIDRLRQDVAAGK